MDSYPVKGPIKLRPEEGLNIGFWIVENILFCRWHRFKNNPRFNNLVLPSIVSVSVLGVLCILLTLLLPEESPPGRALASISAHESFAGVTFSEKVRVYLLEMRSWLSGRPNPFSRLRTVAYVFSFFGTVYFVYWNRSSILRKQWEYCAGLYNDYLTEGDPKRRALLSNALAMDVLTLNLWAHRSFSDCFAVEFNKAARRVFEKDSNDLERFYKCARDELITETEAKDLLERYQEYLWDDLRAYEEEQKHNGKDAAKVVYQEAEAQIAAAKGGDAQGRRGKNRNITKKGSNQNSKQQLRKIG